MPNVGLVLSGGFAKGAYQVGVLKALNNYFSPDQITCISASSIGVLNAYAFVQNRLDYAEEIWRNQKFEGINAFIQAYIRSSYLSDAISYLAKKHTPFPSQLYTSLINVTQRKLNYVNLKDISPEQIENYLQASISLPVLSKIPEISGNKLCDGAPVDNIPIQPLMKHPLDYAIVVHFDTSNYIFENKYFDSKIIKINFMDSSIIRDSLAFDKDSISYMIKTGYEESMTMFDLYFKNGVDDVEYILSKIRFINDMRGKQSFRLTGDIVVRNMNKALKRIIRAKI